MEINEFSEHFSLFNTASPEILEWLSSVVEEEKYPPDQILVTEDNWGKSVSFIVSGWVKVRYLLGEQEITLEILGKGDYFGEMAVLDESLRSVEVISLSEVELVSLSAQRFIQMLLKDPQLQQRMLQLTIRRVRQLYRRLQLQHQLPKINLVKTLLELSENYGYATEKGTVIFNITPSDLANIAGIDVEEANIILEKLVSKNWIEINPTEQTLCLTNPKQLIHIAKQLAND